MDATDRNWRERTLRTAVLAGDETAWRTLYDESCDGLYAFVRLRLRGDGAAADEIVQECWMVAVRSVARFDPDRSSFQTWLLGIARNLLRNHHRKQSRLRENETTTPRMDDLAASPPPAPRSDALRQRVALALSSVSARYRAVLRAKYGERRSVAAIATDLGRSPKAVESLLARARQAFRDAFQQSDPNDLET